jgi:hypothetical protein
MHTEQPATNEALSALLMTFVRPMCFQSENKAFMWGIGTCFLFHAYGNVYAATAQHIIQKFQAEYQHIRITLPGESFSLPIQGAIKPVCDGVENQEEIEDFVLLHIDDKAFERHTGRTVVSLDLEMQRVCPTELPVGAELLVAGYLDPDNRYDLDNKVINDIFLIRNGSLANNQMGYGVQTMEGSPSQFDFNGLCGSPVFAKIDGNPKLVGLVTRGSGSSGRLHFIEQKVIFAALNNHR